MKSISSLAHLLIVALLVTPTFAQDFNDVSQPSCPAATVSVGGAPPPPARFGSTSSSEWPRYEFWCETSNGEKEGPFRRWEATSGTYHLRVKGQFAKDKPDGTWVAYGENGTGEYNKLFVNGVLRRETYFDDRGKAAGITRYDAEGRKDGPETFAGEVLCTWQHGKRVGICYDDDHRGTFTFDANGEANGPCTVTCDVDPTEGVETCKGTCVNGKLEGVADVYWNSQDPEQGEEPFARGPFKAGEMDGCDWQFDETKERGCMKEGQRDGEWRECDHRGQCTITVYDKGEYKETKELPSPIP